MLQAPAPELLAAIVESSDDGIVSKTLQGIVTSWNRGAERIFGYTAAEVIGRPITILFPPDRLGEEEHFLRTIASGGRVEHFETERVRKDGERIPVSVTLSPVRDANGVIVGASKIVRDISERRQLERRAAQATADLERILSTVGEGLAVLDRDLRYIFVNDAAVQMMGMPRQEVVGRTPWDLFPLEVTQEILPRLEAARARGTVARYEAYHPAADRWFENRVYPAADSISIFFSDITSRRKAEEALRRSEEAQRLLVSLNDAARGLLRAEDVMWEVVKRVGAHFGVGRCTYGDVDVSQEYVVVTRDYTSGVPSVAGRHRLDDFGPLLIRDLKAGRTVVVADVAQDPRTKARASVAAYAAIETRALLCVPLVKAGRFAALFLLHHPVPRAWSADDVSLMEQIAERTWFAVENARAEAALRESRDVLALAMRGGRMGAWARNLFTNEVWWSRELEEIFGLPPGGFAGTEAGFLAFVHEEDRARVESAVAAAIADRTDYVVDFRFRHPVDGWRWMEGRGRAVYSDEGNAISLYGLGIDITERREFENALSAARDAADADAERLSVALSAARLGDWSWDAATDLVLLSGRAAEIFGVDPQAPITWTALRELLHPDDRERARLAVADSLARQTDYLLEYRLVSGGRDRWVTASGRGRYAEDGRVLGMFGVVQDITRDRLLVRLDDLVRTLTDPEAITYTAASVLGKHLDVDRCAYAVVEDDESTFTITGNYTRGTPSIVGRYRLAQFGEAFSAQMRAGEPYVVDDSRRDPRLTSDDQAWYEATGSRALVCVPIRKDGRLVAAMAVYATTARAWRAGEVEIVQQVASRCWESIERARVARERTSLLEAAQAANRAKDEFMAMLGHELRNPLSPILTALELMKLRGVSTLERERTVIERQVMHLTRLVDDLLDVSRIARGKVELKTERIELAEVVARAVEIASPLLEERRQTLTVDVPRSGLLLEADAARLSQVVSNLLTNAAKYTPAGGRVSVSGLRDAHEIVLRVRDTGIGIAADVLPRVFELFVQGHQPMDRAQGGLGLGLAIVRSLVERHGGRVAARSEGPGLGSEFEVRLPLVQGAGARVAEDPSASVTTARGPGRMGRLLVVDDNADAAEMMAEAFRLTGYDVRVAHDGPEALGLAAVFQPHAAFLDLGLPVMDGFELAERLRELPGLERLRLVAVTGYGQESDRRRTAAAGFHHHVVKPVNLDALVALLAELDEPTLS